MLEKELVLEKGGRWAHFRWEDVPVLHGFSTTLAGNMAFQYGDEDEVQRNRTMFFERLGLPEKRGALLDPQHENRDLLTIFISPQHGDRVLFIERWPPVFYPECDGVITTLSGWGIALLPADCLPIIIHGTIGDKNFIGLIHAGRQGTKMGITGKAIDLLISHGVNPKNIHIAIGPGIHVCCYRFGPIKIDLPKINIQQALDKGVPIVNITVAKECTYCATYPSSSEPLFFSHRRAKVTKEKEGRFVAFVALTQRGS